MERLEVLPSELRNTAATIRGAAEGIEVELGRLTDRLDALRLAWEGSAQVAFDHAQTRARHDIDRQRRVLMVIARAAAELAEEYGNTDRTAAHRLGGQGASGTTTVKTLGAN